MHAEIVSIGEELLLGEIVDTNAAYIAQHLVEIGIVVRHKHTAGDERAAVAEILGRAFSRTDVIIITGGLGPTQDDITREAIADAAGRTLDHDETLAEAIGKRFGRPLSEISPNNLRQALVIAGSQAIPNPRGTAPGIQLEHAGTLLFAMPGVPHEMRGMFADAVLPVLRTRMAAKDLVVRVRRLHVIGLGESAIDERLGDLMARGNNPEVGTRVGAGMCTVRILARAANEAEAAERIAACEARCREALGEHVFGTDEESLEANVIATCAAKGLTLAIAESCTGGQIAGALTDVAGASKVLLEGMVTYSNEAKVRRLEVDESTLSRYGAVSAEVAREMAEGARRTSGADLALALTGIAGPGGGTPQKPVGLVHFAVASRRGTRAVERRLRGERAVIRERAVKAALGLLREEALALG